MDRTKSFLITGGLTVVVAIHSSCANPATEPGGFTRVMPENVGISASRLARIDEVMEKHVADGRMIGGFGLIARQGDIAYWET